MNLIIAGDFAPGHRIANAIEQKNYHYCFNEVRKLTLASDYAIVNLECPIVNRDAAPIYKCGPNFKCTKHVIEAIKYAGFNGVSLANNHIFDYGEIGIEDTIVTLQEQKIDYFGGGKNILEASSIFYKSIKGKRLAIVNCCEHEFSIATSTAGGANPLNPVQQWYSIQEAKKKADHVIVIVHGGHEHYQLPSPRMQKTYRFFIDAGADAVVNHHQHCYSGYEIYNGKPIFYGLGNFCFDKKEKKSSIWYYGYMVELHINKDIDFVLYPYEQCKDTPNIQLLNGIKKKEFEDDIKYLNGIIASSDKLQKCHEQWMMLDEKKWLLDLTPFSNRYIIALISRKILPLWYPQKKIIALLNRIACESHRDKLTYILTQQINRIKR